MGNGRDLGRGRGCSDPAAAELSAVCVRLCPKADILALAPSPPLNPIPWPPPPGPRPPSSPQPQAPFPAGLGASLSCQGSTALKRRRRSARPPAWPTPGSARRRATGRRVSLSTSARVSSRPPTAAGASRPRAWRRKERKSSRTLSCSAPRIRIQQPSETPTPARQNPQGAEGPAGHPGSPQPPARRTEPRGLGSGSRHSARGWPRPPTDTALPRAPGAGSKPFLPSCPNPEGAGGHDPPNNALPLGRRRGRGRGRAGREAGPCLPRRAWPRADSPACWWSRRAQGRRVLR